ncbi:MAG: pseudouridine synthase, partial [Chthoniobacterales bacterium]
MLRSEIKPALSASGAARANFRIIDETNDYIVVDKPPLLLVHPSKPDGARTLWGELRNLLAFEIANGGQVSIVNRLDRETSGIVLVAKAAAAARQFGLLMQQQRISKEYFAIVWGWPEWETKSVNAPIARQGAHQPSPIYLKQMIHSLGATAQTDFAVLERFQRHTTAGEKFSLVRA